jgi:ribonuclease-3 family protein
MENYFKLNFTPQQVNTMTNLALAHVGDGAYELLVRSYLAIRGDKTVQKLHRDTVELVKAPTQAKFADKILPHLTDDEAAYYRRGKNSHTHAAPKSASPKEYAKATGLETLFGALYLMGQTDRLVELFGIMVAEE